MSTLRPFARLAAGLAALLLAGGGSLAGSTAASAAPFPADWQPISDADIQRLADWGIDVSYSGSRTISLTMQQGTPDGDLAGFVVGGREYAVEESQAEPLRAGDAVPLTYGGFLDARAGESVPINSVAHVSYWRGGTQSSGSTWTTWITDYSLDTVPADVLTSANIKGHNPDTLSDCVTNTCGITIAPAHLYTSAGWNDADSWLISQDSIFIPINYSPQDANGVRWTNWDDRDVTWTTQPGRVTGTYSGIETLDDGSQHEAFYTATVTGSIAADAPWYEPAGWEGASTWNPCPLDPSRTCIGVGQEAQVTGRESSSLLTLVSYDIGDEVIPGTPVDPETPVDPTDPETPSTPETPGTPETPSTPSVDDPTDPATPAVDDPSTPQGEQQPAIPSRVESGAYGSTAHVLSRLVAGLATLAAAATIPVGLIRRRRGGTEDGAE